MDLTRPITDRSIVVPVPACSKCGGQMEEGFILDEHYTGPSVSNWIAGKPEFGQSGLDSRGKRHNELVTFACIECGYLESYIRRPKHSAPP